MNQKEHPQCIDCGYLVDIELELPTDPKIFYADTARFVGCNRVWCHNCGQFVRQWGGYYLKSKREGLQPTYDELRILYETKNPEHSPFLYTKRFGVGRVYACLCHAQEIVGAYAMNTDAYLFGYPATWACAGHPQL